MSSRLIRRTLIASFALLAMASAMASASEKDAATPPTSAAAADSAEPLPLEDLRIFAQVLQKIRDTYVEPISDHELLEAAIRGLLYDLDPHSAYLDPRDFSDLQVTTTGEFGGVGIEVSTSDGFLRIISPIDDTPASRAGLKPGDIVIKIDGSSTKSLGLDKAIDLMRGKIGSTVTLDIAREGTEKPFSVKLQREKIRIASVRSRELAPGFGLLRITQFQTQTGSDAEKQLHAMLVKKDKDSEPLRGLIIDLRNNPGGVLGGAQQVADLFLDSGNIVYTQGRVEAEQQRLDAMPGDVLNGLPIVVLVNAGTASAAEIVAGALQDHRRAVIVGTPTFGKGSVQTVFPLQAGRALKLTTSRYFTPSGRSIQAQGIVPDIEIEDARLAQREDSPTLREADLPGHLSNSNGKPERNGDITGNKSEKEKADTLADDYQMFEALNILRGIAVARQASALDVPTTEH